jgi:hypothetical protein
MLRRLLAEDQRSGPEVVSYSFDDDLVGATDRSTNLALLQVRANAARESLLRARENFIPELYESVEDL